jgi:hypothetical protein
MKLAPISSSEEPITLQYGSPDFYDMLGQLLRKRPSTSSSSQTDTPPILTIVPPKVRHSPSTESTTSRDSTAEHFTHVTANDFVFATFKAIEDQLEKHA